MIAPTLCSLFTELLLNGAAKGSRAGNMFLLLPALITSPPQLQLEKLLLAAGVSPDSMLERSAKVRFQGQWGGNSRAGEIGLGGLEGGGSSVGWKQWKS